MECQTRSSRTDDLMFTRIFQTVIMQVFMAPLEEAFVPTFLWSSWTARSFERAKRKDASLAPAAARARDRSSSEYLTALRPSIDRTWVHTWIHKKHRYTIHYE